MSNPRVYERPDPGAPEPGDIVAVVQEWDPNDPHDKPRLFRTIPHLDGLVTRLGEVGDWPYCWLVVSSRHVDLAMVHSIRWPTESELAAYRLGQEGTP